MSRHRKFRHRLRMRMVDRNIARLAAGLLHDGMSCQIVSKLENELPKEHEMTAKDKYWVFCKSKAAKGYRKGAHRQPKWTKITNRTPPFGF